MYLTVRIYRKFLLILFLSCFIGSATYAGDPKPGALILLGDILRYNQYSVWKRIFELAGGDLAKIVVIAAAHERAKLYGEFAVRALKRYGPLVELLPLSISADEFNIDYRQVVHDPKFIQQVREADGVFFVAGAPQRLAEVLFENNRSSTPLADAIRNVYTSGGVIVGGIPGHLGVSTDIDTMLALEQGRIAPENLYRGLDVIADGWFVDQQILSPGRFAETLVAMYQTGKKHGIGIHADSTVIFRDNQLEVFGEAGAVIIDLSDAATTPSGPGFDLKGVRLSYLTKGDRFDISTLKTTLHAETLVGFEIDPNAADRQPMHANRSVTDDLLLQYRLMDFMSIALDSEDRQTIGLAFREEAGLNDNGFKFRFYTGKDTWGWLTTRFEIDRYIAHNIHLDISPINRNEATKLKH